MGKEKRLKEIARFICAFSSGRTGAKQNEIISLQKLNKNFHSQRKGYKKFPC